MVVSLFRSVARQDKLPVDDLLAKLGPHDVDPSGLIGDECGNVEGMGAGATDVGVVGTQFRPSIRSRFWIVAFAVRVCRENFKLFKAGFG
ncbi:MAG: hypothetical protein IPP17_00610 [Bacteroidetes bacterium]|nr:hypothetical protein [Bacteroidota bacterium]